MPDRIVSRLVEEGELCGGGGEKEKARQYLNEAINMYQEMNTDYWLTQAQAALDQLKKGKE